MQFELSDTLLRNRETRRTSMGGISLAGVAVGADGSRP